MRTRSLRTLTSIARLNSFLQVAEQLNMTLSAVSMQMKSLERELGATLFDRSLRPPCLTPLGRAVAEKARAILAIEAELMELCSPAQQLAGNFRLGIVPTASVRLLPNFLRRANVELPEARFEFETGLSEVLEERLRAGRLDGAVLTTEEGSSPGLHTELIRREPLRFAAQRKLMQDGAERMLSRAPFLHFMPGSGIGKLIAKGIARIPREAGAPVIVLDSVEAIMECVGQGLGFTLLPEPDIARYARPGIERLDMPELGLSRHLVLATRHRDPFSKAAGRIAGILADTGATRGD